MKLAKFGNSYSLIIEHTHRNVHCGAVALFKIPLDASRLEMLWNTSGKPYIHN
jgi:hypothetical protein